MESFKHEWKAFKTDLLQSMRDMFRDNNELIFQEIRATKVELRKDIQATKSEVIIEITEFIDDRLLPRLDDHEQRLVKLETKTV